MYSIESDVQFGLIIYPFIVPQVDLYYQEVSLALLRVLNNLEVDILVIEYFILPSRLPKLVKLIRVAALPHQPSSTINLDHKVVVGILSYSNIRLVAIITAIAVSSRLRAIVISSYVVGGGSGGGGGSIIIRVEEEVVLILRAITSVAIIIELEAIVRIILFVVIYILSLLASLILICLLYFPERVFASFTLRGVNELGGLTASIGLEEQDYSNVKLIVLGRIDILIPSLVLDEEEKQVIQSSYRLGFRRRIQLKLNLQRTINILYSEDQRSI